ncbi:glycine-rich cell wall structural protein 1.8-like [Miscanthus floridulus]|uniref:glycine-rich cell wall structural protein 1.8-like n=1 Tax=Miscanthus floridulus TaxID=154761 RepID=UPI00345B476F
MPTKTIGIVEVLWVPSDSSYSTKEETHHYYLKNLAEPPLYGEGRLGRGQGTAPGLLLLSARMAAEGWCGAGAAWGHGPEGAGVGPATEGQHGVAWGVATRAGMARPGSVGRGGVGGGTWGMGWGGVGRGGRCGGESGGGGAGAGEGRA